MNNNNDSNKMVPWLKFLVLGMGAAGAIYGAVKYMMNQQESAHSHESGQPSRANSTRRRRSLGAESIEIIQRECEICSEPSDEFVVFLPCMHSVVCSDCGARMRKCISCHRPVAERITEEGRSIPYKSPKSNDDLICSICCENKKRIIFNCGHTVCKHCSERLTECPLCRETITTKNHFF